MTAIHMRPYQAAALEAINTALDGGVRRQLLVMATGGGKTIVFGHLICQRPGRALVLAHRDPIGDDGAHPAGHRQHEALVFRLQATRLHEEVADLDRLMAEGEARTRYISARSRKLSL